MAHAEFVLQVPLSPTSSGSGSPAAALTYELAAFEGVSGSSLAAGYPMGDVPLFDVRHATILITSGGTGSVTLSDVTLSGDPDISTSFVPGDCEAGMSLAQGQSCPVSVSFAPTAEGSFAATLNVSGSGGASVSVPVTGQGSTSVPVLGEFTVASSVFGATPFALTPPTSTSAGGWSYTSSNPAVATISGSTVTVAGAGSSTITATQAASGAYTGASTSATFTVSPAAPTLGSFTVPAKVVGASPFTLTPPTSASAGGWTYTSSNPAVATVSGSTVTVAGAGSSTITATQAADGNYSSASTSATLTVTAPVSTTKTMNFDVAYDTGFYILAGLGTTTSYGGSNLIYIAPGDGQSGGVSVKFTIPATAASASISFKQATVSGSATAAAQLVNHGTGQVLQAWTTTSTTRVSRSYASLTAGVTYRLIIPLGYDWAALDDISVTYAQ